MFSVVGEYLSAMPPFGVTWGTLRDRCENLPDNVMNR
jgi:hypothetical protein